MAHDRKAVGDSRRQAAREVRNRIDAEYGREEAGRRAESEWAESGRAESGSLSGREAENGAERETGRNRDGVRARLRGRIMEELTECRNMDDQELLERIDTAIRDMGQGIYLPLKERIWLRGSLYDSFRRLDILQELVDDPTVTEIMVNGTEQIFIEKNGRMQKWKKQFETEEQLEDMIQQIVSRVNRMVNASSPIADARLEDGSRVHIVLPPVALDGPAVTIRKFPEPITVSKLVKFGSITQEAAGFLGKLVASGYNIFICGGTNSGKSTFLNALSAFIPSDERLVTIEDSAELQIQHIPNLVRLETRNANGEGEGAITIRDLIRAALRMNPSRIIVGEVRGAEALEMLQAMNTGHDGSMSTGHGNSPKDMLSRLETMVLMAADIPLEAVRSQISAAVDILIHLGRLRDKSRRVLMIAEIGGMENGEIKLNPLYQFKEEKGQEKRKQSLRKGGTEISLVNGNLEKVGELQNKEKLEAAGYQL